MNKGLKHYFGDGLLIVFSILLALGVNEWRSKANDNAELKRTVQDLSVEISNNLATLDGIADYHRDVAVSTQKLASDIRAGVNEISKTPFELFVGQDVLKPSVLGINRPPSGLTWQIAKDRGIVGRFDHAIVKDFSQSYDLMDRMVEYYSNLADSFGTVDLHLPENQSAHLSVLSNKFQEMAAREDFLVFTLERNLKLLEEKYPDSIAPPAKP